MTVPLIDPKPLWDFDDPAASQARLLAAADAAAESGAKLEHAAWLTQVARAMGLQEDFSVAHSVLDSLAVSGVAYEPMSERSTEPAAPSPAAPSPAAPSPAAPSPAGEPPPASLAGYWNAAPPTTDPGLAEVAVRLDLERGRLYKSAGDSTRALPLFESAAARAEGAGLEELQVDALHMAAIAAPDDERLARNQVALAAARGAADPVARNWDASILNNIGMVHADAGDFAAALAVFEEALAARERIGDPARTRVAKWMIAWSLRNLGRTDEALAAQRALKAELDAAGATDPYVDQELAILEGRAKAE